MSWSWLLEASIQTQFAKILTCYFVNNSRGQVVDILTSHPANGSSVEVEEPEVISHLQLKEVSFYEFKDGAIVHILMEKPPLIHAIDLAVVVT